MLAASTGVQAAFAAGGLHWSLVTVAVAGLMLLFALWWLYFLQPSGAGLASNRNRSFLWGYGHYGIFAAVAAVGAGLEVAVEGAGHHLDVSAVAVGFAVAIPVAVFLFLLWAVHGAIVDRPVIRPVLILGAAVVTLLLPPAAGSLGLTAVVTLIAALCALLIMAATVTSSRRRAGTEPGLDAGLGEAGPTRFARSRRRGVAP